MLYFHAGQKRLKTLQLRSDSSMTSKAGVQPFPIDSTHPGQTDSLASRPLHAALRIEEGSGKINEPSMSKTPLDNNQLNLSLSSPHQPLLKNDPIGSKVKMMKAASLFDSQKCMDIEGGVPPPNVSAMLAFN